MMFRATGRVQVTYYDPLTHFYGADLVRLLLALAAVCVALLVLLLARARWREQRRSASVFLIGLAMAMGVFAQASIVALGRPPAWWLLAFRAAVITLSFGGCLLAIGEARRGVWARRA